MVHTRMKVFHLGPSDLNLIRQVPPGCKESNSPFSVFFPHNLSPDPQFESITFERIMRNCFPLVRSQLKQILVTPFSAWVLTGFISSLTCEILTVPSKLLAMCGKLIVSLIRYLYFSTHHYPKSKGAWIKWYRDGASLMALRGMSIRPKGRPLQAALRERQEVRVSGLTSASGPFMPQVHDGKTNDICVPQMSE